MMEIVRGNFLEANAEALVNTVNCVGIMGKGIALQSKKAFPENFNAYEQACRRREVDPGRMFVFSTGQMLHPRYIINFPTKKHWIGRSRYEYIESGLKALVSEIQERGIHSVAIPPLGCGLGGLDWRIVRPMIEKAFSQLPDVHVLIFEPAGAPPANEMPVATKEPRMTLARALFIKLIEQYDQLHYRLTLLEIQKLAYFLQESGQELKLNFVKGKYGPYAGNLNKVLEVLEGHFIRGYGDNQKPDVEIELMKGAIQKANTFLDNHPEAKPELEKVATLVDGFETPYGMELLSSVHWVVKHETGPKETTVIEQVLSWNERKKRLFRPDHIRVALHRLLEENWITEKQLGC